MVNAGHDVTISPHGSITRFHIDSGLAIWHDLIEGEKDWAVCDLRDGIALGLNKCGKGGDSDDDAPTVRFSEFIAMPSARILRLRAGESLFMPSGCFHFVVGKRPSFSMSNNLIVAGGVAAALDMYNGIGLGGSSTSTLVDDDKRTSLARTHRACALEGVARVTEERLLGAGIDKEGSSSYFKQILDVCADGTWKVGRGDAGAE